jgi:hypothetical protein
MIFEARDLLDHFGPSRFLPISKMELAVTVGADGNGVVDCIGAA